MPTKTITPKDIDYDVVENVICIRGKGYVRAELLTFCANNSATAAVKRLFRSAEVKSISEFDTWESTILDECAHGVYAKIVGFTHCLIYQFQVKKMSHLQEGYFKVSVTIGCE